MKPLLAIQNAIEQMLAAVKPPSEVQRLPLLQLPGRVLAQDIVSSINVPPQDNSAMDGYAIRYADLGLGSLRIAQRIPAGSLGAPLERGTAARIFTGAPIPPDADTVVMQEDVSCEGDQLTINEPDIKKGQHIRPLGQDIASGSTVLAKGRRCQSQDVGLLASIGLSEASVYVPLKVALISTGDELVEPGEPLRDGQIYNSNRYMLSAFIRSLGCELIDGGIVEDDYELTCRRLADLALQADLIVSTGGVSVGEEDHVKGAVEALGALALWKLNIKPGKPVAFGRVSETPFIGLPGNPTSSFVTFCVVARPYILRSSGQHAIDPVLTQVSAGFDWPRSGTRQEYVRVLVDHKTAHLYNNQSSGVLASTSWANALAVIEPGQRFQQGGLIDVLLFSELR